MNRFISTQSRGLPGDIVHVRGVPYKDGTGAKDRYGLIVGLAGGRLLVRGIYSKHRPGYAPIEANCATNLHHCSYVANWVTHIPVDRIDRTIGQAPHGYDPFDDFNDAAA